MTKHYEPVDVPLPRCRNCGKITTDVCGTAFVGVPKCDGRCREREAAANSVPSAPDPYAALRRLSVELILNGSCPMSIDAQSQLRALLAERDALKAMETADVR